MGLHDDDDLGMEDGDDIDEQLHGSYLGNEDMGESKFNRRMHYLFLLICTKEHWIFPYTHWSFLIAQPIFLIKCIIFTAMKLLLS